MGSLLALFAILFLEAQRLLLAGIGGGMEPRSHYTSAEDVAVLDC